MDKINIPNLKVALSEDLFQPGKLLFDGLNTILDTCRLVFVYPFINTDSDGVATYGEHINLKQSLEDPEKKHRIIPLQVGDAQISDVISIINPVEYSREINDEKLNAFKNLVEFWRAKLP